ncbi:MAG: serine protease [Planctomycetota bacterium]|nr:serine protease [Planctomycetota bacterium]
MTISHFFVLLFPWTVSADQALEQLVSDFEKHSGAELVFNRSQLPAGSYHDVMPEMSKERKIKAAKILNKEVRKYPSRYFKKIGLKAIGFFEACVSKKGDGFRPYNRLLKGYRYYGIWNGKDALAGAYYTDGQLPLTFHHEVFHHIDATRLGTTNYARNFKTDDPRFKEAVTGRRPYKSPEISDADLRALKARREGYLLRKAVSDYAAKHPGEDQAETARHFMTTLSDSLVQVVQNPRLEGSQRILHIMGEMEQAIADGPDADWFVDVALGRERKRESSVLERMAALKARQDKAGFHRDARKLLEEVENKADVQPQPEGAEKIVAASASLTHEILRHRISPVQDESRFKIWGSEDEDGVNWTLRTDVLEFATDATRLKKIAKSVKGAEQELLSRTHLKNLRLLAKYYVFIDSKWTVTPGTQKVFEAARDSMARALPVQQAALSGVIKETRLRDLATLIEPNGDPQAFEKRVTLMRKFVKKLKNPYIRKVDEEISDKELRAAIRGVQPACVSFSNASGVNLSPEGWILTAAHVAVDKGKRRQITFPDGRVQWGICTAIDKKLDLAIFKLVHSTPLPYAPISPVSPKKDSWVACIGQPGTKTPKGKPTGYQPFNVSTGRIRGFLGNPLGSQRLGRAKHDAWTYWGHSGSPLFNSRGEIVAMHNSWDPMTAMRHAVPHEAIVHFLKKAKVRYFRSLKD